MPNWNTRVEQELRSLDRLLSVTLTLESKFGSVEWDLRAAVILGRMRRLYFQEQGSLGFLRRLAAGQPIAEKERLRLRALHDSFEAEMEAAAEALRVAARRNGLRIDMDAMALLEGLVNDSTCIRDTIHGMFAAPVGALIDTEASRNDARFILAELEPRLTRFHEAETRLRMRARSHGVELPAPGGRDAELDADAEAEALEAAEARAAFIGAAPSAVSLGATRSGLAGTLRNMVARETSFDPPGEAGWAARRSDPDGEEHEAAHPDQHQLDLDQPRRATRSETASRRWATRRLARVRDPGADAPPQDEAGPESGMHPAPPAADQSAAPPAAPRAAPAVGAGSTRGAPLNAPAANAPPPNVSAPGIARAAKPTLVSTSAARSAPAPAAPEPAPAKRRWSGLRRLLGLEDPPAPAPSRREPAASRAQAPQRREPEGRQSASPRGPGSPIRSIS